MQRVVADVKIWRRLEYVQPDPLHYTIWASEQTQVGSEVDTRQDTSDDRRKKVLQNVLYSLPVNVIAIYVQYYSINYWISSYLCGKNEIPYSPTIKTRVLMSGKTVCALIPRGFKQSV